MEERYLLTKAKLLFQLFDGLTGIIVGRRPILAAVALKRGKQLKFSSFCGMDTRNRLCRADSILKRSTATRQRKRAKRSGLKLNYKLNPTFITRILHHVIPKKHFVIYQNIFDTNLSIIFIYCQKGWKSWNDKELLEISSTHGVNGILFGNLVSWIIDWIKFLDNLIKQRKLLFRYKLLFFRNVIIWKLNKRNISDISNKKFDGFLLFFSILLIVKSSLAMNK